MYGGMSTAVTPQQTAAAQGQQTAADVLSSTTAGAMPAAQAVAGAAGGLTPAAQQVAGSTGNLAGAAQNVIGSTAPMTGAAYGELPAAYAQLPAAYNMMNAASMIPSFAPQSTSAVQQLFANAGMLPAAYQTAAGNYAPIASTANLNPYQTPGFGDALDTLTQNITNQVKGSYAASGRDPSGAGTMPQTLARGLMQGEEPVIASQYNTNVANALNANQEAVNAAVSAASGLGGYTQAALGTAGMLPSVYTAPATAQWQAAQAPLTAAQNIFGAAQAPYQAATTQYNAATMPYQAALTNYAAAGQPLTAAQTQWQAANAPATQAQAEWAASQAPVQAAAGAYGLPYQNLLQLLSPAMGLAGLGGQTNAYGTSTGTITPANNAAANILGLISGVAGLVSERSAKTDIKDIGRTHDNQKIYSFRFKGSNVPQIGMMADEVQKKTPSAVVMGPDGMRRVNYDYATRKAQTMGMLSKMAA